LPSVIAGQSDMMWSNLYYTATRAEQVNFVTYLLAATRGVVRKGNPKNIHSLDDACGARAAAGLGTVEEAMFRGVSDKCVAAGKPPLEIVTYPDRPTGIRMLLNDRTDLLMGDAGGNAYLITLYPNDLESGYVILTDYKVGPGIGKSLPELRQAIFNAMQILQADGTQKTLMVKYGIDPELQRPVEMFTK
jgi:polar amino acid transport system substrate-binding protein